MAPKPPLDGQIYIHRGSSVSDWMDDQGQVKLERLDAGARRLVDLAHLLAQQRGLKEIPQRLLLAVFLTEPRATIARILEEHGVATASLGALLIATGTSQDAESFPLTAQTCARAVLPMLQRAQELVGLPRPLDVSLLFQAFCQVAHPQFKTELRRFTWPQRLDLEVFAAVDQACPHLDPLRAQVADDLWRTLIHAARTACLQGCPEIRTPHLATALLRPEWSILRNALAEQEVDPDQARKKLLETLPPPGDPAHPVSLGLVRLGSNAQATVALAQRGAHNAGLALPNNRHLLAALLEDSNHVTGVVLRKVGVQLPLTIEGEMLGSFPE